MKSVTIRYSEVKRDVLRMSEYVGLKSGSYDRIRAIDNDDEQLRYWYHDGLAGVCVLLDRALHGKVVDGDEATLTFAHDNDISDGVGSLARRMIVTHIIVRWLKLVAPQLAEQYASDYIQQREELSRMVYYREMPK